MWGGPTVWRSAAPGDATAWPPAEPVRNLCAMRRLLVVSAALLASLGAGAAGAGATPVSFLQGEQLVTVERPRATTVQAALLALTRGPTAAERRRGIRNRVLRGTPVRSVTVTGGVATVDFGTKLVRGDDPAVLLARLGQVVGTATAVPGVRSVRVRILGGTPMGLFPGVDARVPLTMRTLRTPDHPVPVTPDEPVAPPADDTRVLQQRLADLGYLAPSGVDGRGGPATTAAIIAFQKWQRLARDGQAGPQTRAALAGATRPTPVSAGSRGRRLEILLDRQVVLAIENGVVVRTIHASTGAAATPTTTGSFSVYGKFQRWWSVPFRTWLPWSVAFVGGIALHEYPDVPVVPASHGCVRLTPGDARWVYDFSSVGTPVRVLATS